MNVHTSASEPAEADLFGMPDMPLQEGPLIELDGVLIEDAQVRSKPVGDGLHVRPVLWLNIRPVSGLHRTVHIEQIYTEATRKEAEGKAATLRKGSRVTVTTPVTDMHIVLPHVRAVTLIS